MPSAHLNPSAVLCPLVSVILPIRNEAPFIEQVLRAVLDQDYPRELMEAIVVDGMSDDGTREIVRRLAAQDARLKVLDNPQLIAPSALNLGIRAARGEVIVRVDGHGVLPLNYVRECVSFLTGAQGASPLRLDRGEGQGEVSLPAVVPKFSISAFQLSAFEGCPPTSVLRLVAVGGGWDSVGRGWVGEAIALAMSSTFGVGNSLYRTCRAERQPVEVDTVAFWAVRREVFEGIGLFREEMLCHEDYEFNYRLRCAGGTILLLPWLRSKYYVRSTLGGLARQYWRYGVWKGRFLRSHPESLKARHLIPPLLVMGLAGGALASLLGTAGRFGLGSLVALYAGFLLAATASLAGNGSRRRETADGRESEVLTPQPQVGPWRRALLLPLILTTLHLCWGGGVWVGLVRGKVAGQAPRLGK